MRNVGKVLAATGVAILLTLGAANAQGTAATGTGTAAQQNQPSTVGVGRPGGRMMKMHRHHRHHHRHHRHHHKMM